MQQQQDNPGNEDAAVIPSDAVAVVAGTGDRKRASTRQSRRRRRRGDTAAETKKRIAETSETIRKKYLALKMGKMAAEAAVEKQTRPIVEPLKQLVESVSLKKPSSPPPPPPPPPSPSFSSSPSLSPPPPPPSPSPELERKAKKRPGSRASSIVEKKRVRGSRGDESAKILGPTAREYLHLFYTDTKRQTDNVYGVYLADNGRLMIGDSTFDANERDDIVLNDETAYRGTRGLYELMFKRIPDDDAYTPEDLETYRRILLATNTHKRGHSASKPTLGNKGYKYKRIIAPLLSRSGEESREGHGLPMIDDDDDDEMTVTDNAIDYVYWDDPNELVDRLRLLVASQAAGHTGHDNEIVAIVEELREAGLVIN